MDIYDFFQNLRINHAHQRSGDAHMKANDAYRQTNDLEEKIDSLSLAVLALSELLEEVGFTKEIILKKIEQIDLRDGKLDGKLVLRKSCDNCGRVIASRHIACIYCGEHMSKNGIL